MEPGAGASPTAAVANLIFHIFLRWRPQKTRSHLGKKKKRKEDGEIGVSKQISAALIAATSAASAVRADGV